MDEGVLLVSASTCEPAWIAHARPTLHFPLTPRTVLSHPSAPQGEPLRRYFYGLYSQNDLSAFEANMYLAEDRVLCLEIVARKNSKY